MNLVKTSALIGLASVAAIASTFAMADETGWYGGANIGRSSANIDDARITSGLASSGLSTTSISNRDRDTAYKIYGGYQFNKYIGLEGGYFDLGKFGFKANTFPLGTLDGNIRLRGVNLDAVGTLPLSEKFSALGRIGINNTQARDSFTGTGAVNVTNPNPSKRDTNYKLGVGVQYAFNDALAMRAEIERYRINDAIGNKGHVDVVSVGLVYNFGGKTPSPAPRMAVSEPVFVAAAPEPVVVVPPPPAPAPAPVPPMPIPMPMKVTFSADALFDFNKAVVKPEGKQALDKFAADLKGTQYDAVQVRGHTDRIGSTAYNLKLSSRRADAVSAYLVQSGGVQSGKIAAKGVDGSDPVTKPGDCKGSKASKALIACLQPDRRVEVEVSATK
jgi:OmpA-OmpF porin, OOP family